MITSRPYNILVPRFDRTGPCNVAVDIGREAKKRGFFVRLLALSGGIERDDLGDFDEVRLFKWRDLFELRGYFHTHCYRPDLIGGIVAKLGRCTVITTLHNYFLIDLGFDHRKWKVSVAWHAWKYAVSSMDQAVCISDAMRRYYRCKLPRARLATAYNFRSTPKVANETEISHIESRITSWLYRNEEAGRTILAFVGSIHRRKNLLRLVEALGNHPNVALVVCGEGPLRGELDQLVAELRISERVLSLGSVPNPELVVERVDALVLPSLAEGMPLVVLEAARLGKPALMSNIAVHREMAALGLGKTFDHRRFSDFGRALGEVKAMSFTHGVIRRIWEEQFMPAIGFARYEQLLDCSKPSRQRKGPRDE